jgi:MbtH protein
VLYQERGNDLIYTVLMNDEEQYSIWPADRDVPDGWRSVGKTGPKDECLSYIDQAWTDMRPLSLRKQMEQDAAADERAAVKEV